MDVGKFVLALVIIFSFAFAYWGKSLTTNSSSSAIELANAPNKPPNCKRIISLAPSITETLFALDLGSNLVGVTTYCDYPPKAKEINKVGGYFYPNNEAILTLKPSITMILSVHTAFKLRANELGISTLMLDNQSVSEILNSMELIGNTCEVAKKAKELVSKLQARIDKIKLKVAGLPKPRILISVGRNMGSGSLTDIYIAGKDGFFNEMISLSGGVNAFGGSTSKYPIASEEGILKINPDVIIDIVPDLAELSITEVDVLKQWSALKHLKAVKEGRVHIFGDNFAAKPGPRFILILEKLAKAFHPKVNWDS
tara:strand:- start:112422 stop:113357 length:936 start_codon:yes stop_codon:yes gene_type:complete